MTYLCTNCTVAIRSLPIKDSVMSFVQVIFLSFRLNINICDLGCFRIALSLLYSRLDIALLAQSDPPLPLPRRNLRIRFSERT